MTYFTYIIIRIVKSNAIQSPDHYLTEFLLQHIKQWCCLQSSKIESNYYKFNYETFVFICKIKIILFSKQKNLSLN